VNQTDGGCKATETEVAKLHPCVVFQRNSRSEHSSCKLWFICTKRTNTVGRLVSSSIQIAKRVCVYFCIAAIQKLIDRSLFWFESVLHTRIYMNIKHNFIDFLDLLPNRKFINLLGM
jgi:hypothetical protein